MEMRESPLTLSCHAAATQGETAKSEEQWIPISVLNTFNRMKARDARMARLVCHDRHVMSSFGRVLTPNGNGVSWCVHMRQVLVPSLEPQPIASALAGSETVEVSEDSTKVRAVLQSSRQQSVFGAMALCVLWMCAADRLVALCSLHAGPPVPGAVAAKACRARRQDIRVSIGGAPREVQPDCCTAHALHCRKLIPRSFGRCQLEQRGMRLSVPDSVDPK